MKLCHAINDVLTAGCAELPRTPARADEAIRCAAANVPERDATILREYRAGRSPSDIAMLLRIRREDVARSLARSFAGMRISS